MGQQQLLLIILGVIIVGIAIAVGIALFGSQSFKSHRDNVIADLNNIGAEAHQYRIRPTTMGGGGGSYVGYPATFTAGAWGPSNPNASYTTSASADQIVITGQSKVYAGKTATLTLDANGTSTLNLNNFQE